MRIEGRTAVVTGAGGHIGRGVALRLAAEGAAVVVNDIREAEANETVRLIRADGGKAVESPGDVSVEADVERMIEVAIGIDGRVDILCNIAGFWNNAPLHEMSEEVWDAVVDTCLKGTFLCTKHAALPMREQRYGRIVNISSRAYLGNAMMANYSAAKAGIVGLTFVTAKELGPYNITANAICLGTVDTPEVRELLGDKMAQVVENTPLRRVSTIEDVAHAVLFLASDEVGTVTGDVLNVTGGTHLPASLF
jgi:3-oxoacyl-[acyl-carrier protein] reductase